MSEKITKTIKEAGKFQHVAMVYAAANPDKKISYALKRVVKFISSAIEPFAKKNEDDVIAVNIKYASVDEKKNIVYEVETVIDASGAKKEVNTQTPKYSIENKLKRHKEVNELSEAFGNHVIEFENYMATEIPVLTDDEIEAFAGYVIPEGYKNPETEKKD